jgi:hypothetical protein
MEHKETPLPAERGSFGGPPARPAVPADRPARHTRIQAPAGLADQVAAPGSPAGETDAADRAGGSPATQERTHKTAGSVDTTPVARRFPDSGG